MTTWAWLFAVRQEIPSELGEVRTIATSAARLTLLFSTTISTERTCLCV